MQRDSQDRKLPYGAAGIEHWENKDIYPRAKSILEKLDFSNAVTLDLGFGRGEAIRYSLDHGGLRCLGIDFSDAAYEIAGDSLKDLPDDKYELVRADALRYMTEADYTSEFDYVLMLDAIEHIPRSEMEQLLPLVYKSLKPGGTLVVDTPFYEVDEDLFSTDGPGQTRDSSDQHEETKGMHINRYTKRSLAGHLSTHGFIKYHHKIYLKPLNFMKFSLIPRKLRRVIARKLGYGIK